MIIIFIFNLVIAKSHPEWMTDCGNGPQEPLDVTESNVTKFVKDLYHEIFQLYLHPPVSVVLKKKKPNSVTMDRDTMIHQWVHIGGDEIPLDCWNQSTKIRKWMVQHNMSTVLELLHDYESTVLQNVIQENNMTTAARTTTTKNHMDRSSSTYIFRRPMIWQELFDSGVRDLPNSTIIDVWKSWDYQLVRMIGF